MTPPPSPDVPTPSAAADPTPARSSSSAPGPPASPRPTSSAKRGVTSTVLEADDVVGGISRTVERDGWRFDIGGHRFFTKVKPVEELWHEILDDEDFILRPRMSRIYYDGKYFDYPLKAVQRPAQPRPDRGRPVRPAPTSGSASARPRTRTSSRAGWRPASAGASTAPSSRPTPRRSGASRPRRCPADWAAQRIKNLSLFKAVINALLPKRNQKEIASLIEEFEYPKYGPGMMWERCTEKVAGPGLRGPHGDPGRPDPPRRTAGRVGRRGAAARSSPATNVISSMPFTHLLKAMDPPVPAEVLAAADDIQYRDFLTVALVVPEEAGFPDNWIYIHAPEVQVGRIQNFGSWSPYLVKDGRTCLGLEYFVFEGDDLWTLAATRTWSPRATRELVTLGLIEADQVEAGLRGAPAEGLPDLRRDLRRQRRRAARAGSRPTPPTCSRSVATGCTSTTTRTTRCTRPC